MRRAVFAIIVALLTFSASGLSSVMVAEPCTGHEQPSREEGGCPPTCVTCGCCAQAVDTVAVIVPIAPDTPIAHVPDVVPGVPHTTPRDILHVPKPLVA